MKTFYRGFTIEAKREGEAVSLFVFRDADQWELWSEWLYDLTVREVVRDAVIVIEEYLKNPEDFDE